MDQAQLSEPVRLDGRKLEGGGQLVRIAVALSALTGKAVKIDHIRGNRPGKRGLKVSHLAAITMLSELSGSTLVGAEVGSCSVEFYPPQTEQGQARRTDSEINIRLPTPGSVFLVFQPSILHLCIIGGTNVSSSPSYDYVSQVLLPNFARVGLPAVSVRLEKRGWASGQRHMGKVIFTVDTLRRENGGLPSHELPSIDLRQSQRGSISKIDITILAPDDHLDVTAKGSQQTAAGNTKPGVPKHGVQRNKAVESKECEKPETIREFMERYAHQSLRKRLEGLPPAVFPRYSPAEPDLEIVPIKPHTTEATLRRSCMYVLIVAHTSTRFKIGRDALYGSVREQPKPRKRQSKQEMADRVKGLVDECVENFFRELCDPLLQKTPDAVGNIGHQPCVDEYMRDQLVVFEALARVSRSNEAGPQDIESREDERYWSLHTKTAQWVCQEMFGEG
ncbi:putative RNA 3'-terminal phosphate cyclase [Aspergillus aurantiobrunneus]